MPTTSTSTWQHARRTMRYVVRSDSKMKYLTFSGIISLLVGCVQLGDVAQTSTKADEMIGYYTAIQPAHCKPASEGGTCWGYVEEPTCLHIMKDGNNAYKVEAFVIDTRGFSCSFVGSAEPTVNGLKAYPHSPIETGQHIFIEKSKHSLVIREDKARERNGFCGAFATIDGLSFPLSDQSETRVPGTCATP